MNSWKRYVQSAIGILTLVGLLFSAYFFVDARFAKCADVQHIERRLEYKIENDQLIGMQQRIWSLDDRYPDISKAPVSVQEQRRELDANLLMQRNKVQKLENK